MENNNNQHESWKFIAGFDRYYEISDFGRVRSYMNVPLGRILKPVKNTQGYSQVTLMGKKYLIHRLVALAFIPNPENKNGVNHKDCNPSNNHIDNLEWATQKENIVYAVENGNMKKHLGSGCHLSKIDEDMVIAVNHLFQIFTGDKIAKLLKLHRNHVYKITSGETWSHLTGLPKKRYPKNQKL